MNPELQYKIVAILAKLFPDRRVSVSVEFVKHRDVFEKRGICEEYGLYVADTICEEFESVVDLLAYVKQLTERSEITVWPETLNYSDFERQTKENL
jgi:hypothetical protein